MVFRYAFRRILRTPWASLATAGLAAALSILLILLITTREKQEAALENAYDAMEIRCVITSADGVRTDGLRIPQLKEALILVDGYGIAEYIRDLEMKVTFLLSLKPDPGETPPRLIGITSRRAAPELAPEYGYEAEFLEGYGWVSLESEEPLLIVSQRLLEKYELTLGDAWPLGLESALYFPEFFALSKAEREFRVIGVLHGMQTEMAYCPFEYLRLESVAEEETNYAESASFILGDNRRLDEFREAAPNFLKAPDATAGSNPLGPFALVIHDQLFRETISSLMRDIRLCSALMPVVCLLCVAVGLCSGLIGVRARRQELVLLRCVGTPRRVAFALMLLEQAGLGACGALLGALGMVVAGAPVSCFAAAAIAAACFAVGAAAAAGRFVSQRVAAIMQQKE